MKTIEISYYNLSYMLQYCKFEAIITNNLLE